METYRPATAQRSPLLQNFLDELQSAFSAAANQSGEQTDFTGRLFACLSDFGEAGSVPPARLPVCDYLPSAFSKTRGSTAAISNLARTLEKIAPLLAWKVRSSGGPHASDNWPDGHANAVIIGKGGLEERDDVAIGASLLAPHVRYPDHTHPPEELYMVLTPGRFQHGDDEWCEPGPGGTFHNPPGIKHAMASGEAPLLAIWTMIIRPS